ncbi:secreted trypsin-like serine protease [Curtobacterium pusillum]|uniref:Secreted trypsin-like serine protease n=1 Tax=Curtobacterium pusillum TaxID=69373 RepID=A0AAW3T3U3_9MICO|nr:S1 family peptidase [Curtobacterium pusillum]MBA8989966.1 secreted trypsin-like serine protease [Curtobacterium pusillum]
MKQRQNLRAATLLATAALTLLRGTFAAGAANAATVSPQVIGGEPAPSTPWEVQLVFQQGGTATFGCTGEQLNASWVITARHCVDGTTAMNVYHSNSTTNRGPATAADRLYSAPAGDIALVHLRTPKSLASYAQLDLGYSPRSSGTGTILGYGNRANSVPTTGLYQATVSLTGSSTDAYRGIAQHVTGVSGASNHGDSGGALVVNGRVVGVCSTGDVADPGANTHAGSNYAVLAQSASWIRSTAGV